MSWSSLSRFGAVKRCWFVVRAGGCCSWCGVPLVRDVGQKPSQLGYNEVAELDHVHPRGEGGCDETHNIVASCRRCNSRRALSNLFRSSAKLLNPDQLRIPWSGSPFAADTLTNAARTLADIWYPWWRQSESDRKTKRREH